jgi:hypothetical protein
VRSTPEWAQKVKGYSCGAILPEKLTAFATLMHDVVKRYSVPPYNVKYWELSNEPDIDPSLVPNDSMFGCWGDVNEETYGGEYYAEMLKQVYPRIKEADAESVVLVGGLLLDCDPVNPPGGQNCAPARFLEGILRNGGGDFFDGVSFHAYDYYDPPSGYSNKNWHSTWNATGPVQVSKAQYLSSVLRSFGYPEKYLINTESGLLCGSTGTEPECQTENFNKTKASYIAQVNVTTLSDGLLANVWYSLTGWRGTALVNESLEPLPAYQAYQYSAETLLGASYRQEINIFQGVRGYELSKGERRIWILWSLDGQDHIIKVPKTPLSIHDVFGSVLPIANDVTVTLTPLYIEWTP